MKKKFLALVMTLSMVLSLVPMTALATGDDSATKTTTTSESQTTGGATNEDNQGSGSTAGSGDSTGASGTNTNTGNKDEGKDNESGSTGGTTTGDSSTSGTEGNGGIEGGEPTTTPEPSNKVAKIGNNEYETLDEAIAAAENDQTIQLLKDFSLESGITVENKTLTIQGDGQDKQTITLKGLGIHADKSNLTFKDCGLEITANDNHGHGGTANLISNSNLTFDNVKLTISSEPEGQGSGLYLYQESNLYLTNYSVAKVSGYNAKKASGIYADNSEYDGMPNRNIKVSNHAVLTISDCDWHGMTINPIDLTIDGYSKIDISKCGNEKYGGGLGCYYGKLTISDHSSLYTNYNNGSAWGTFVKELSIDGTSDLSSCNNLGNGLNIGGKGEIVNGSTLIIEENQKAGLVSYTGSNYWYGDVNIEQGANVEIHKNNQGIYVQPGGKLNMQDGNVTQNSGADYGGGLWNEGGTVVLSGDVAVYNNHAKNYGDDIYSASAIKKSVEYSASITFGATGEGWKLDGAPDCEHEILGWFKDGMAKNEDGTLKRWNGDGQGDAYYADEYTGYGKEAVSEDLALKAAHPLVYQVKYVVTGDIPEGYVTPAGKTVKANGKYTVEAVPASVSGTKDGVRGTYSFVGWTTKDGTTVTGERTLTQDETLYGVWSFRRSGGSGGGTVTIPDDVPTGLDLKNHYGYIIGYPVDYYTGKPTTDQTKKPVRPEGKITRAEVATIYFRMLTDENRAANWNQVSGFSDVKRSAWYNNAVSTLTKAGILKGYEDGTFQPDGYITRAEFATIAIRFFSGVYEGEDLFPDIKGHWAEDYINNAANKGLVKGYEDGTFGPDRYITRAEAVTLVNRTLNRHPHNDGLHKDMLVWPDNMDTSKWYYADMQEATNSHEPDKNKSTADKEYWGKMLPIRDWEALEKEWSNANSAPGEGEVV